MAQKKPRASVPWSALDSAAVPTDSMNTLVIRIHQTNDVTTRWAPPPDVILQGMQEAVLRQPRHDL